VFRRTRNIYCGLGLDQFRYKNLFFFLLRLIMDDQKKEGFNTKGLLPRSRPTSVRGIAPQQQQQLQGWLHKKGEKGLVRSYKRRWFQQQGNKIYYFANKGDKESLGLIDCTEIKVVRRKDSDADSSGLGWWREKENLSSWPSQLPAALALALAYLFSSSGPRLRSQEGRLHFLPVPFRDHHSQANIRPASLIRPGRCLLGRWSQLVPQDGR